MPIDLMSPLQAIESATMKLVAKQESEKHLDIARQNADSKRMTAEAYKNYTDKQLDAEQKLEMAKIEKNKANANARKAKYESLKYQYDNSKEAGDIAEQNLKSQQEAIRNSQVKLGGDE